MAIGTATRPTPAGSAGAPVSDEQQAILSELRRTGRQVKLTDLAGQLLIAGIALLSILLVLAIVDHWIMPLGFWGRLFWATAIAGSGLWFTVTRIVPLLLHRIHPSYAARTIENSTPALKNSLINFLMLREHPSQTREVVLEAVQRRAAADIKNVQPETVVDRTYVIRLGYALCAVMAVLAIYKIASPKDPFQTIARVALPFAEIARPSRVTIDEVTPGTAEVLHGENAKIAARISGLSSSDRVIIRYSSRDGSIVDREVPMLATTDNVYFEALLPAREDSAEGKANSMGGMTQDLEYCVIAGDAETPIYQLIVTTAPTIIVSKVEYQYPAYTKLPPRFAEMQGDLQAIEGTTATIYATTSHPLASAVIGLDIDPKTATASQSSSMQTTGDNTATFPLKLELRPGTGEARPANYSLRFTTKGQLASQHPIVHRVEVLRDLAPEVQLLEPKLPLVELPLDQTLLMEVRAVDPDFALRSVELTGTLEQTPVVTHTILEATPAGPPQIGGRYQFTPSKHDLKIGDEITFIASAVDNKTSSETGLPAGNLSRSTSCVVRIIAESGITGKPEAGNRGASDPAAESSDDQATAEEKAASRDPAADETMKPQEGVQEKSQTNSGAQQKSATQKPSDKPGEKPSGNKNDPKGSQGANESSKPEAGGEQPMPSSDGSMDDTAKPMGGEGGEPMPGSESDPMSSKPEQGQPQAGGEGSEGGGEGAQPMPGQGEPQQGGKQGGSPQQGTSAAGSPPPGSGDSGDPQSNSPSSGSPKGSDASSGTGQGQGQQSDSPSGGQPQNSTTEGGSGTPGGNASGDTSGNSNDSGTESTGEASRGGPQKAGSGRGDGKPHDGEVIDELLNHLKETQGKEPPTTSEGSQQSSRSASQTPENSGAEGAAGEKPAGAPPAGAQGQPSAQRQPGDAAPSGDPSQGGQSGSAAQQGNQPQSEKAPNSQPAQGEPGAGASDNAAGNKPPMSEQGPSGASGAKPESGGEKPMGEKPAGDAAAQGEATAKEPEPTEGGDSRGAAKTKPEQQAQGDESQKPSKPGQGSTGQSGAGSKSQEDSGSGAAQEENRDRPKDQTGGPNNQSSSEASAPSGSKKQSNSKGGDSGDRSGGGGEGGGQSNGQAGNDSAGSNSSADTGAGKSSEKGEGESGEEAGDGTEKGNSAGGKSAGEKGNGSSKRGSPSGDKPGTGAAPKANPGDESAPQESTGDQSQTPGNGSKTGPVVGGGLEGGRGPGDYGKTGPATEGDAANLDYARRATDMALEHLRDQEHNPDPELLKRLRMTRDELSDFLRRWESLENEARENPAKSRELDESLRSLGLAPSRSKTRTGGQSSDNTRDLRDSGDRTAPPPRYRDLFDAFRKGAARSSN